jgi:hypothetical protein
MRHLYKIVALLALLLLMLGIYRKSTDVEQTDPGSDLPVNAATRPATPRVTSTATLTPTRSPQPQDAPSEEAWIEAVDTVLRGNLDVNAKSRRMIQLFPQLPPSLQPEAAQHLVNFATDAAPESVTEPLLLTNVDDSALGVLLLGLLQRGDKIRLPVLLQIARNPEHPKCGDALHYLRFLLESEDPADSAAWEARIEARLHQPAG